jgi:transposase
MGRGVARAVEGAGRLGHLLAQQLVAAGERVLDIQPKLGSRVRLLSSGRANKNDPNDALSVAVAGLRSPRRRGGQASAARELSVASVVEALPVVPGWFLPDPDLVLSLC